MNTKEPFDLAKMGVTLLLVCLVLACTIGFFYMMYDKTNEKIDSMEKATASASMDRLRDLEQQYWSNTTDIESFPLVTNVVSALVEFEESDVLFVNVIGLDPSTSSNTYTYSGVTLAGSNLGVKQESNTPVTMASRELLQYSNCRCSIRLQQYDSATGQPLPDGSTEGLTGIFIQVYKTQLGG